jgi:phenylalanyl-tRNA synthetase alpha chain
MIDLDKVKKSVLAEIDGIKSGESLEALRVKYLGRKGVLTEALKSIATLKPSERGVFGAKANVLKKEIELKLSIKDAELSDKHVAAEIDFTAPGVKFPEGHRHPITLVYNELFEIGKSLGFSIATGPEVENDWYNFEALNFPPDHPARDTQDSFFFSDKVLLRTHTSPVQIRYMESHKPPIRIMAPGRTYRRDSDATHTPMFHQLEGLLIDENASVAELKGTLEAFVRGIFGKDRTIRLRPHFFPFTEPSFEVDVSCGLCGGKGCRSCKNSGWLEVLGAGMVHPNVLKAGGIDPTKYQGFAFGMGIERLVMLKYGVDDMRMLYEGDLRLTEQF